MKFLREETYYSSLYDRFTVEECRRHEQSFLNGSDFILKSGKPAPKKRQKVLKQCTSDVSLYFIKGQRYARKSETLRDWMERDKRRDNSLERAKPPLNINCVECDLFMDCIDKELYWGTLEGEEDRILFTYECMSCQKRRGVFDNGHEFKSKPRHCPQCVTELNKLYKKRGDKIDTIHTCADCGYKEIETMDFGEKPKERFDENFLTDKKRFCMDEKEGGEFIAMKYQLEQLNRHQEEQKEKEKHKELYDRIAQIKKLTLNELEKMLTQALEKENFLKFVFATPDVKSRDLYINFTVQEGDSSRNEQDGIQKLKELIKAVLADTNWRLMSDGISYRMGILYGRIRGYEREEDLLKIIE